MPYRADTFLDGWSTPYFTVRLASVRGYSHRYQGVTRQDEAGVAIHAPSGALIFAVADGVSSAKHSHVGAVIACQAAIETLARQLDDTSGRDIDWRSVAGSAAGRMADYGTRMLRLRQPALDPIENILATTLIAGYVVPAKAGPAYASMIRVGDSGAWVLDRDSFCPVLEQKNHPEAQIVSSAVHALPRMPERITPVQVELKPHSVLLIGTDGFGDPLGDGQGQVGRLFAENLRTPPRPLAFAHLLDFSRETFDDDRTLVAVWIRSPESGTQL